MRRVGKTLWKLGAYRGFSWEETFEHSDGARLLSPRDPCHGARAPPLWGLPVSRGVFVSMPGLYLVEDGIASPIPELVTQDAYRQGLLSKGGTTKKSTARARAGPGAARKNAGDLGVWRGWTLKSVRRNPPLKWSQRHRAWPDHQRLAVRRLG